MMKRKAILIAGFILAGTLNLGYGATEEFMKIESQYKDKVGANTEIFVNTKEMKSREIIGLFDKVGITKIVEEAKVKLEQLKDKLKKEKEDIRNGITPTDLVDIKEIEALERVVTDGLSKLEEIEKTEIGKNNDEEVKSVGGVLVTLKNEVAELKKDVTTIAGSLSGPAIGQKAILAKDREIKGLAGRIKPGMSKAELAAIKAKLETAKQELDNLYGKLQKGGFYWNHHQHSMDLVNGAISNIDTIINPNPPVVAGPVGAPPTPPVESVEVKTARVEVTGIMNEITGYSNTLARLGTSGADKSEAARIKGLLKAKESEIDQIFSRPNLGSFKYEKQTKVDAITSAIAIADQKISGRTHTQASNIQPSNIQPSHSSAQASHSATPQGGTQVSSTATGGTTSVGTGQSETYHTTIGSGPDGTVSGNIVF